jgi:predicted Zn finger-like uncharacterized protein
VFTQCAKCETVFRLSAEALRAAGGQVRCGRCGEVFNALARLAEDATGFTQGESPLELETRADAILNSALPVEPVETAPTPTPVSNAPPGVEIAQLQISEPLDDSSMEFTLPPGELDRIFVETRPSPLQQLAASLTQAPSQAPSQVPSSAQSQAQAPPPLAASPTPRSTVPVVERITGLEVSEEVRREMLSSYEHAELPPILVPRRRVPYAAWVCAAVALFALLIYQVIRNNGDWLAAHAHVLGGPATPAAKLAAYQLRQWGVTGDPGAKGTLRVRATIMNVSAQLQPYPLLRVTLANRFGTHVGAREFEPAEYLGHAVARLLAPGERADATLDILDPGKDAEGFEIDVCLRASDAKMICAADIATPPK